MRELRLVGLSADGQRVIFVDDAGAECAAPADDRLRAALRGDRARLGQLEIDMESALRPRDIQARIRAGESAEAVAALAGVPVEKIMAFCVPVIAERQHIAQLAGRSHVRRTSPEGQARRLFDVVAERLAGRGIDPDSAQWNAWRREDGRWTVQASYRSGESERTATFAFDAIGRYSLADDDEARWLTGERQATSKGPQPRESGKAGERRLSAVPTGDDLLTLSRATHDERADEEEADDLTAVVRAFLDPEDGAETREQPVAQTPADAATPLDSHDEVDETVDTGATPESAEVREAAVTADASTDEPPSHPAPQRRKSPRRASVPSWDEIMFGRSKDQ